MRFIDPDDWSHSLRTVQGILTTLRDDSLHELIAAGTDPAISPEEAEAYLQLDRLVQYALDVDDLTANLEAIARILRSRQQR